LDSASNDIGFARDATGAFQAVISEYDRGIGFDDAWLGRLAQVYKEKQTMAIARAKGYVFKGREVVNTPQGKNVQLRFPDQPPVDSRGSVEPPQGTSHP